MANNNRCWIIVIMLYLWIILISLMLCINYVSAFEFDNKKEFNSADRSIIIKNTFLNLFDLDEVAKITPLTPHNVEVIRGKDRLVAEFEVENYLPYTEKVWDNMDFYNINFGNKKISRNFKIKILNGIDKTLIPQLKTECLNISAYLNNGTEISECKQVFEKNLIVENKIWKEIDYNEPLQKGKIHIGIFTDVEAEDYVEFVPTWFGVSMSEYSTWTEGLTNGLVAYYNFTDGVEQINRIYNFTTVVGSPSYLADGNEHCLIGGCYNSSTGKGIGVNTQFDAMNLSKYPKTLNIWFKPRSSTGANILISGRDYLETRYRLSIFEHSGKDNLTQVEFLSTGETIIDTQTITKNIWNMITVTINETRGSAIYLNGNLAGTGISSITKVYGNMNIGVDFQGSGAEFEAYVDELASWNRTLTTSEIQQLYNNGFGVAINFTHPDMLISLVNYPNQTGYNLIPQTILFNSTATTTYGNFTNATLYIWNASGIYNLTYSGIIGIPVRVSQNISATINSNGNYIWNIYYCALNFSLDTYCRFAISNNTFYIDSTAPIIAITHPTNTTVKRNIANMNVTFSVQTATSNLSSCWYNNDGGTNKYIANCNSSINSLTSYDLYNLTGNGRKNLFFYANNTLNTVSSVHVSYYLYNYSHYANKSSLGEGDEITFTLELNGTNITAEFPYTNATIKINNVNYAPDTAILTDQNIIVFTKRLVIPVGYGNTTGNIKYYNWTYNIKNSSTVLDSQTTDTKSFTTYNVSITDCAIVSGRIIINLSLKDEEDFTYLNVVSPNTTTIELNLKIISLFNSDIVWEFSKKWINNQSVAVCVPNELLNSSTYRTDFTVGYDGTDHVREFYYLENGIIGHLSLFQINLYDLLTADSTSFLITFINENGIRDSDVIIHILRKYIGLGQFIEVERSKNDENGRTIAHLVEEDVIYKINISKYNSQIYLSNEFTAKCLETPCSVTISAEPIIKDFPIDYDNLPTGSFSISVNKTTRMVTLNFNLNESATMNLTIFTANNVDLNAIASGSLTASSGNFNVFVPYVYGNVTYYAVIYKDGEFVARRVIDLNEDASDYFGTTGLFIAFFSILVLILIGATHGEFVILWIIVGFVLIGVSAVVNLSWYALTTFIAMALILLIKLATRRSQL